MKVARILARRKMALLYTVIGAVATSGFAQEVDIDSAQPAVLALLGIGAAVTAGRTIYRMTRKGAGEASV